jgi:hypothetical protein
MCSHNPYQTTQQNMNEVLDTDLLQRMGQGGTKQLVKSALVHDGIPGSGVCKHAAQFTYSDGSVETMWGV